MKSLFHRLSKKSNLLKGIGIVGGSAVIEVIRTHKNPEEIIQNPSEFAIGAGITAGLAILTWFMKQPQSNSNGKETFTQEEIKKLEE